MRRSTKDGLLLVFGMIAAVTAVVLVILLPALAGDYTDTVEIGGGCRYEERHSQSIFGEDTVKVVKVCETKEEVK